MQDVIDWLNSQIVHTEQLKKDCEMRLGWCLEALDDWKRLAAEHEIKVLALKDALRKLSGED